jgi:hypothetical protein
MLGFKKFSLAFLTQNTAEFFKKLFLKKTPFFPPKIAKIIAHNIDPTTAKQQTAKNDPLVRPRRRRMARIYSKDLSTFCPNHYRGSLALTTFSRRLDSVH